MTSRDAMTSTQSQEVKRSEELVTEQLKQTVEYALVGTGTATGFALLLAWQLPTTADPRMVIGWVLLKLAIAIPRIVQSLIYRSQGFPGGKRWRLWIYCLLMIDGFVWGLAGFWVATENPNVVSIAIPCLVCVAIIASYGFQASFSATALYVVPILLPTVVGLQMRVDKLGTLWGFGLLVLLGLLLSTARRSQARITENFLLRLQAVRNEQAKDAALALAKQFAAELGRRAEELEVANRTDQLTGVANREGFMRALRNLMAEGDKVGAKGAVFYIDLDGFKAVNDSLGHDAGDAVLASVARHLSDSVRVNDLVARVGGDEFAIVAHGLSTPRDAHVLAAKMMAAVAEIRIPGHEYLTIGATIGACLLPDARLQDAETAVRRADALMFEAKRAAKGSFRILCEHELTVDNSGA